MEFVINEDVVLVVGAVNSAIYNFNNGKIFHINKVATSIIIKYINEFSIGKVYKDDYLLKLESEGLISKNFKPYVYKEKKYTYNPQLKTVWLEITEACNLRCIHCYEGKQHMKMSDALSISEWKCVIDQLKQLETKRVIIIGGEPCCGSFVRDITEYCGKKQFDVTFFTNATMIDEKLIDILKKYNISVKISIYGGSEHIHDQITKIPGSFKKMDSNIDKLISSGIKIYASIIIMKENQDYLNDIISYVKSKGIIYKGYDVIRNVFGGEQSDHTPDNSEVIRPKYITKPSFVADKEVFINNHNINSCWFGKIAIQENGNVLPCVFQRDIILGNVKNQSINEVINLDTTKKCWCRAFDQIDECKDCEYRYACKDCRALGISVCGSDFSKNPRCLYDPYKGEWMNILEKK